MSWVGVCAAARLSRNVGTKLLPGPATAKRAEPSLICGGLPNMRLKLSARGDHICRKRSILFVAAAGRSLNAIR
jgi:hypothetical protein